MVLDNSTAVPAFRNLNGSKTSRTAITPIGGREATHKLTVGMIEAVVGSAVALSMFTPLEPLDYVFAALSSFGVTAETFIIFTMLLLLADGIILASSLRIFLSVGAEQAGSLASMHSRLVSVNMRLNWKGLPCLAAASFLIAFWHLPGILDAAILKFRLHLIMSMCLLFAGVLTYAGFSCLSGKERKIVTILGCKAMGIFGVYLLLTSGYNHFYAVYPLAQQVQFALAMVIMMLAFDGLLIPYWLYRFFANPA